MLSQTDYPGIEYYARSDYDEIAEAAEEKWGFDIRKLGMNISEEVLEEGKSSVFHITFKYQIEGLDFSIEYNCYDTIGEDLEFEQITEYDLHDAYQHRFYMSINQPHDAKAVEDRRNKRHGIQSSIAIMAAGDDDPFADMGFDAPEDDNPLGGPADTAIEDGDDVEDAIDDVSDTLDQINDALEDFDEDAVDIETENNIEDHYIAECEKCHGVFITAVEESDQVVEKISGTCPLCDEDCDQYLKWIVKAL